MAEKPGSEPAYPIAEQSALGETFVRGFGLTLRQHAAIQLRVPESGEPWLDDMIRRARRLDYIKAAMQGLLSFGDGACNFSNDIIPREAVGQADACLKLEAETRGADNGGM